jgi:hypothetical protein
VASICAPCWRASAQGAIGYPRVSTAINVARRESAALAATASSRFPSRARYGGAPARRGQVAITMPERR